MKRKFACLALCMILTLTACGAPAEPETVYEEPVYEFDTVSAREEFTAGDSVKVMTYSYQFLQMSVPNLAAVSPEERTLVEKSMETFNGKMNSLLKGAVEQGSELADVAREAYEQGYNGYEYSDEATAGGYRCGDIISVWVESYSYLGGAHGNSGTSSYLFDLSLGRFVDPLQIADDPETFRTGAAELLIAEAEADAENLPGYWSDYRDIISHWNEGAVIFDRIGMTAVYSPYEIGPFAMGTVELTLSYDELASLLGEGGLRKLGVSESE